MYVFSRSSLTVALKNNKNTIGQENFVFVDLFSDLITIVLNRRLLRLLVYDDHGLFASGPYSPYRFL
jgi:hypothetical protein